MKQPTFDKNGYDRVSFAPFALQDCLETKWADVRLYFDDWHWYDKNYQSDKIDGYYMNGYGIEGLVRAVLSDAQMVDSAISYSSDSDTCNVHFKDMNIAAKVASLAAQMIADREKLTAMIKIVREQGLED